MTQTQSEQGPTLEPSLVAEWNGSSAEVYNLDALFAPEAPREVVLLEEDNLDMPIKHLAVTSQRVLTPDSEAATLYHAEIEILPLRGEWQEFIKRIRNPNSDFKYISEDVQLVESNALEGVYHVMVDDEPQVTIEINPDRPHIFVHTVPEDEQDTPANNTPEAQQSLLYFLTTVIRTADYIAGFREPYPSTYHMDRTYMIGHEQIQVNDTPASLPSAAGRLAIEGSKGHPHHESEGLAERKMLLRDLGGLKEVKEQLQQLAISRMHPEIMRKWGAEVPNGVFLYGPTGNGKTMLINALANEMEATLISVRGSEVIDMWVGNSEKKLETMFAKAHATEGNVILFFDEFETIIGGGNDGERKSVAGAFKRLSQDLPNTGPHVLLAAASNHFDSIEPALVASSRFDLKLYIGNPDEASRVDMIASFIDMNADLDNLLESELDIKKPKHSAEQPFNVFAGKFEIAEIAQATDGFNGAAISTIFKNLRRQKAMQEAALGQAEPISHNDIMAEINAMRLRDQIS